MPRVLLITNPAAARTRASAVDVLMRTFARGAAGARRCSPPAARATRAGSRRTAWRRAWTSWRSSAATAPPCRPPRRWSAPTSALGVIPGGTGNLLAGNLRIPVGAGAGRPRAGHGAAQAVRPGPDAAAPTASTTSRWPAARATTRGSWRRRCREHKRRWGMAAYVATTLRLIREIRSTDHVITIDGVVYDANAAMVLVANCGEVIPPYVRLGAGIRPDDGLLDVVVVRANGFGQSVRAVWDLLRMAPEVDGLDTYVGYARGREIRVETHPVQPVQLDGEPGGETPFTATVVPKAIRIMVPRAGGVGELLPY